MAFLGFNDKLVRAKKFARLQKLVKKKKAMDQTSVSRRRLLAKLKREK